MASTQHHVLPILLLWMAFHAASREQGRTGHLGSSHPRISSSSRPKTPRSASRAVPQNHLSRALCPASPTSARRTQQPAPQLEVPQVPLSYVTLKAAAQGDTRTCPQDAGHWIGAQRGVHVCNNCFHKTDKPEGSGCQDRLLPTQMFSVYHMGIWVKLTPNSLITRTV